MLLFTVHVLSRSGLSQCLVLDVWTQEKSKQNNKIGVLQPNREGSGLQVKKQALFGTCEAAMDR